MSYFIATCKYEKMQENGAVKRVSEKYLCDAFSIVEANAVVTENLKPYISGDFFTSKVENSPIAEVMGDKEADKFYLAKVAFVTIDERSGKEKRTVSQWLIGGTDFNDAYETVLREFNKSMADCELVSLTESKIVEYYPHNNE